MSERRLYENVIEKHGYKYIKLKSGRFLSFWDALDAAKKAETNLTLAISRCFKLTHDDYDLERLEWFVDRLNTYVSHIQNEIEKRHKIRRQEELIASLRNTTGRSPEEAEEFHRKADDLERRLRENN